MSEIKAGTTWTVAEAHSLIGTEQISRAAFYSAIAREEIPSVRIGRRILIPRALFAQWLGETMVGQLEARV